MAENMSPERSAHLPSKPQLLVAGPVTFAEWQDTFAKHLTERVGSKRGYETTYFRFGHRTELINKGLYQERGKALVDRARNLDEMKKPYLIAALSAGGSRINELFGSPEEAMADIEKTASGDVSMTEWDLMKYFNLSQAMAIGYIGSRQRRGEGFPSYKDRYQESHEGYVNALEASDDFAQHLQRLYDRVRLEIIPEKRLDARVIAMYSVFDTHVEPGTGALPGATEKRIKIRDLGDLTHLVSIGKAYSGDLLPYFDRIRKNRN